MLVPAQRHLSHPRCASLVLLQPAVLKGGRVAKYPEDMYAVCAEFMGGGMPRRPGFVRPACVWVLARSHAWSFLRRGLPPHVLGTNVGRVRLTQTSYADIEKQLIRAGCPIREPRKKSDKPGTPDKPVSACVAAHTPPARRPSLRVADSAARLGVLCGAPQAAGAVLRRLAQRLHAVACRAAVAPASRGCHRGAGCGVHDGAAG